LFFSDALTFFSAESWAASTDPEDMCLSAANAALQGNVGRLVSEFKRTGLIGDKIQDSAQGLVDSLSAYPGSITSFDKIIDKKFGNSIESIVMYFAKDNADIYFSCRYNKPGDHWILRNFSFTTDFDKIIR
jgi:hypothetical protein